jgi:hypothetical protein
MAIKRHLITLIQRENKICDLAIQELTSRCKFFEEKYKLSSDDFYGLFQEGKMGDEQDLFEWKVLIDGVREWQQTKEGLKELEM